jgi:RNA polymerase sigma factor (sigma-70 family)
MEQARGEASDRTGSDTPLVRVSASFEAFYQSEYDACVRLAYVLSGSRWGAEDVAQEAFIAAHRRWNVIGTYDNPGAWVRRVIANKSVSWYRRRVAEGRALVKMATRRFHELPDLDQTSEEVWSAVRRLPRRQAQVVALTYLDELSLREIADLLDIAVPTVGTHLTRAREALARMLADAEEVEK